MQAPKLKLFNPNIDESFRTQRGRVLFFFCDIKRVAGMVVLQKLEKETVHSDDVTLNMCFFKVEKK